MLIKITDSVFHHNNALHGICFVIFHTRMLWCTASAEMHINNCTFCDGKAVQGGNMFIESMETMVILSNSNISARSSGCDLSVKAALVK